MRSPRNFLILTAVVLAAPLMLVACESITGPEPPDRPAIHRAPLAGIDIGQYPDDLGVVQTTPNLWLAHPGEICGTLVIYEGNPEMLLKVGEDQYVPISHSDLVVGMEVELWIPPGTFVESTCPGYIAPSHIVGSAPR